MKKKNNKQKDDNSYATMGREGAENGRKQYFLFLRKNERQKNDLVKGK